MRTLLLSLAAGLSLVLPGIARAQAGESGQVVSAIGGWVMYDKASAIKGGLAGGVELTYPLLGGLAVGPRLFVSRTESDGTYFKPAEFDFGPDVTRLYSVSQQLFVLGYGLTGRWTVSVGGLAPYVVGGAGGYTLFLDAQKNARPKSTSGLRLEAGGGLDVRVAAGLGVRLEVRDEIFTDFDREILNPVDPRFHSVRFPEATGIPPAPKETLHNIALNLGFTYTPGAR